MLAQCESDKAQDNAPEISFIGMNKDNINQGSLGIEDTLIVGFSFLDIDGDVGGLNSNIVVIDNRNGEVHLTNSMPELPASDNGNKGQVSIEIPTLCCVFEDNTPPCSAPFSQPTNTLSFNIYIIDKEGNQSNEISTPDIVLRCN